jgi:hypothetical protein
MVTGTVGAVFFGVGVVVLAMGALTPGLCLVPGGVGIVLLGVRQNRFRRNLRRGLFAVALVFFVWTLVVLFRSLFLDVFR